MSFTILETSASSLSSTHSSSRKYQKQNSGEDYSQHFLNRSTSSGSSLSLGSPDHNQLSFDSDGTKMNSSSKVKRSPVPTDSNRKKTLGKNMFSKSKAALSTNVPMKKRKGSKGSKRSTSRTTRFNTKEEAWKSKNSEKPQNGRDEEGTGLSRSLEIDLNILRYLKGVENDRVKEEKKQNEVKSRRKSRQQSSRQTSVDDIGPKIENFLTDLSPEERDRIVEAGDPARRGSVLSRESKKVLLFVSAVGRRIKNVAFLIVPKRKAKKVKEKVLKNADESGVESISKNIRYKFSESDLLNYSDDDVISPKETPPQNNSAIRRQTTTVLDVWDDSDSDDESDDEGDDLDISTKTISAVQRANPFDDDDLPEADLLKGEMTPEQMKQKTYQLPVGPKTVNLSKIRVVNTGRGSSAPSAKMVPVPPPVDGETEDNNDFLTPAPNAFRPTFGYLHNLNNQAETANEDNLAEDDADADFVPAGNIVKDYSSGSFDEPPLLSAELKRVNIRKASSIDRLYSTSDVSAHL